MARYEFNIQTGQTVELPDLPKESIPAPTIDELQAQYIAALDAHIDAKARERGYDNRVTCSMRAGYAGPYQAECLAFALWMDACYQQGTQALADVVAGKRKQPTIEAFLGTLPPMEWPTQKGV